MCPDTMPKHLQSHKTLDLKSLEDTLQQEIEAEKLYWLQNDAKLRAVSQGTTTYEDFRQIVLGAHLQPMKKEDIQEFHRKVGSNKVVWNNNATGSTSDESRSSEAIEKSNLAECTDHLPPIRTSSDLLKAWKTLTGSVNKQWTLLQYLMRIKPDRPNSTQFTWAEACHLIESERPASNNFIRRLWADEVPFEMFTQCINFLMSQLRTHCNFFEGNWADVVQLLHEISSSRRFKLLQSFCTPSEHQTIQTIIETLERTAEAKDLGLLQQLRQDFLAHTS